MFENIMKFFKKLMKAETVDVKSKDAAKERLHLVLMQDRANVSADFLELMKQEIIEVIKKYIDVDENAIDVRLTNKTNEDGTTGEPALYANIPIVSIKEDVKRDNSKETEKENEKVIEDAKKIVENNQTSKEEQKEEVTEPVVTEEVKAENLVVEEPPVEVIIDSEDTKKEEEKKVEEKVEQEANGN